jgi:hypothetical protein
MVNNSSLGNHCDMIAENQNSGTRTDRQLLGKYIPMPTDTHTTTEVESRVVISVQSVPMLIIRINGRVSHE